MARSRRLPRQDLHSPFQKQRAQHFSAIVAAPADPKPVALVFRSRPRLVTRSLALSVHTAFYAISLPRNGSAAGVQSQATASAAHSAGITGAHHRRITRTWRAVPQRAGRRAFAMNLPLSTPSGNDRKVLRNGVPFPATRAPIAVIHKSDLGVRTPPLVHRLPISKLLQEGYHIPL